MIARVGVDKVVGMLLAGGKLEEPLVTVVAHASVSFK